MKRTSLLAVLMLVLGLLAGCGGDDSSGTDGGGGGTSGGIPTDASAKDFCGAFLDLVQQANAAGTDISDADAVKLAKDLADKLAETGTPEDIPAAARRAFEAAIEKINDLPDDATRDEVSDAAGDLSEEEQADQEALSKYITTTCAAELLPSDGASSGG